MIKNDKSNKTLSPDSRGAERGLIMAFISLMAAIGFGTAGFCVEPVGSVSSSVLILIAQFLIMSATYLGLDCYLKKIINILKKQ